VISLVFQHGLVFFGQAGFSGFAGAQFRFDVEQSRK
jgi:hypothetical protein